MSRRPGHVLRRIGKHVGLERIILESAGESRRGGVQVLLA